MKKNTFFFFKQHKLLLLIASSFYLLLSIYLLFKGPRITPDSVGYLDMSIIRGPIYSMFLNAFRYVFNENFFLNWVIIFQLIINLVSIFCFSIYFSKRFSLGKISIVLLFFLLLYPYYRVSTLILTESMAFPLFLIFIVFYVDYYITNKSTTKLIISILLLLILILVRTQFIFIIPVILSFEIVTLRKKSFKIQILNIVLILSVFIISTIADKIYHYFQHGKYTSTPFTGIQLATNAFYIADSSDYELFSNEKDKEIVSKILEVADNNNLLLQSFNKTDSTNSLIGVTSSVRHYSESYNYLCHKTIKPIFLSARDSINEVDNWVALDAKFIDISLVLIKNNLKKFIILYLKNIIVNWFGTFYLLFIFISAFLIIIISFIKNITSFNFLMLVTFYLSAANLALIAFVEPVLQRYTIYTDVLLIAVIIIALDRFLNYRSVVSGKNI
jgi:hypothetical protein